MIIEQYWNDSEGTENKLPLLLRKQKGERPAAASKKRPRTELQNM
jgi:hypothetical protein